MLGAKLTLSLFVLRYVIVGITIFLTALLAFIMFVDVSSPIILLQGNSMIPTLKPGDLIFIHKQHISEIKVGDIIAAQIISDPDDDDPNDRKLFIHRVIERNINEGGIITLRTKGDSLSYADKEQVTSGNYVGNVYFVLPKVASISSLLTNPMIFGAMITCVVVYFLYLRIRAK
ncbi:MAG: signal peptidase I [Thermoproteota archaeon]